MGTFAEALLLSLLFKDPFCFACREGLSVDPVQQFISMVFLYPARVVLCDFQAAV